MAWLHSIQLPRIKREQWVAAGALTAVVLLAVALRLATPLHDRSIGEIDVYFWGLRTEQFELHGLAGGGSLWVLPAVMAFIHRVVGGSLYDVFLWAGPIISGIFPTIAIFLLTKELSRSSVAGVVAGLLYAVTPVVFYRGVFTVSETIAYVMIPLCLYLTLRLYRTHSVVNYFFLLVVLYLALYTHDSAKLLFLPAAVAVLVFFWHIRRKKFGWAIIGASLAGVAMFLFRNPALLGTITFFLFPLKGGSNSAFGNYPIIPWVEYTSSFPAMLTIYTLVGLVVWFFRKRSRIFPVIIILLFVLPIIYYQQIQPRLFGTTIVPFRLTPLLTFTIVPLAAVGLVAVSRLLKQQYTMAGLVMAFSIFPFFAHSARPHYFPLSYITSESEQQSLLQLPITLTDYLIVPNGLLGMAGMATYTTENNYYPDTTGTILTAPNTQTVLDKIHAINEQSGRRITGVLISKWKLEHYDINYGWWDTLVIPHTNVKLFRNADFPVRFEDANLVLFGIREGI